MIDAKISTPVALFPIPLGELQQMIQEAVKAAQPTAQAAPPAQGEIMTVKEVGELLGVQQLTVYRYVKERGLPHSRGPKALVFRRADVLAWFEATFAHSRPGKAKELATKLRKGAGA
jgi:excisionase family DNA binding protein